MCLLCSLEVDPSPLALYTVSVASANPLSTRYSFPVRLAHTLSLCDVCLESLPLSNLAVNTLAHVKHCIMRTLTELLPLSLKSTPMGNELKWLLKEGGGSISRVRYFSRKYAHLTLS